MRDSTYSSAPSSFLDEVGAADAEDTNAYSEDNVSLVLKPMRAGGRSKVIAFAPIPLVSVTSEELQLHPMKRFGYPFGKTLVESRRIAIPTHQVRGTHRFPLEKYSMNLSVGLFGYPSDRRFDYAFHLNTVMPEYGSYYPIQFRLRGRASWAFSMRPSSPDSRGESLVRESYSVTDDYVQVVIRRPMTQVAYVLGPLIGLVILAVALPAVARLPQKSEFVVSIGLTILLGLIALRSTVMPPDVAAAGIVTLYDVLGLITVSAVLLALFLAMRSLWDPDPRSGRVESKSTAESLAGTRRPRR